MAIGTVQASRSHKISNRKIAARLPRLCSRQVERRVIPDCCDFTMGSAFSGDRSATDARRAGHRKMARLRWAREVRPIFLRRRSVPGGIAHNKRTWLKAAASVITVFTPSGGFRGRIRENGEKALIGSLPYRAGKATEDIASFRHHPLHGVRDRGNVVDKANSLSGQPGHLLPIGLRVLGRQNY
jgi:hypothetical protein